MRAVVPRLGIRCFFAPERTSMICDITLVQLMADPGFQPLSNCSAIYASVIVGSRDGSIMLRPG